MTGASSTPYRPPVAPVEPKPEATLTFAHRCDGCGARAYFRFVQPDYSEWLFCAHHGVAYKPRFPDAHVLDERWQMDI